MENPRGWNILEQNVSLQNVEANNMTFTIFYAIGKRIQLHFYVARIQVLSIMFSKNIVEYHA